jgi:sensor histidine kinase regulating citrate/malate metabolism
MTDLQKLKSLYRPNDEEISSQYNSLKIITSLVTHDINNAVINISSQLSALQTGEEAFEIIEQSIFKIQDAIVLLQENIKVKFSFFKFLNHILSRCENGFEIKADFPDFEILGRPKIFVSLMSNIIENAREAYINKHGEIHGMILKLYLMERAKDVRVLVIEDNCGGFDVSKIKNGVSSKEGEGHGVFLKTLANHDKEFDVSFAIERIKNGTRIFLEFK